MEFKKSTRENKKYMVKVNDKWVHFGDSRYQQYKDTTGLNLYSNLNHLDKERRKAYRSRHEKIRTKDGRLAYLDKNQPAYYSYHYLW